MTIKLDNVEFDRYNLQETDDGKNFSLEILIQSEDRKDALIELLTKKHLKLTKESGETVKVTVHKNSYNYTLGDGKTEPNEYHFSVELEKFDRETEINKLFKEAEDELKLAWYNANAVKVIRELLIGKGIFTVEEYNSKMGIVEEELSKKIRQTIEELIDKKFET